MTTKTPNYKYKTCKVDISWLPKEVRKVVLNYHSCSNEDDFLFRYKDGTHLSASLRINFDKHVHKEATLKEFFEEEKVHVIQIDGKSIELSEESFKQLKSSLL